MRIHTLLPLLGLLVCPQAQATVTFYDGRPGSSDISSTPITFSYNSIQQQHSVRLDGHPYGIAHYLDSSDLSLTYFTQGGDFNINGSSTFGEFVIGGAYAQGATLTLGDWQSGYQNINFALLDMDNDGDNETVAAFKFALGGGSLIATASLDTNPPWVLNHVISDGWAEMQAASGGNANLQAIPEPSLTLLSLLTGTAALISRRRSS
ncbi:MAG: hypothetical protein ACQKBY_12645 [Verrucomicrobiales bacterium]